MGHGLRKIFPWFPKNDGKERCTDGYLGLQTGDLAYYVYIKPKPGVRVKSKPDVRVYCQVITEEKFIKAIGQRMNEERIKKGYLYLRTTFGYDTSSPDKLTKVNNIDAEIKFVNECNVGRVYNNNIIEFLEEAKKAMAL